MMIVPRVMLEVCDDGAGFEPSLLDGAGFGLRGMRERAERLGVMESWTS
jgi:signal transduction histidine kinase